MMHARSSISTHILDVSTGIPAVGVTVRLEFGDPSGWVVVGSGVTDGDGRITDLLAPEHPLKSGVYRLDFAIGEYFKRLERASFYPQIQVVFKIENSTRHYHVPLLLSDFGYSTYRGS